MNQSNLSLSVSCFADAYVYVLVSSIGWMNFVEWATELYIQCSYCGGDGINLHVVCHVREVFGKVLSMLDV